MRACVIVVSVFCASVLAAVGQVAAVDVGEAVATRFNDPNRVMGFLDRSPEVAVKLLEGILSQEQANALESAMFPEPTKEEKKSAYRQVSQQLKRLGLPTDDELLRAVSARAEALENDSAQGEQR